MCLWCSTTSPRSTSRTGSWSKRRRREPIWDPENRPGHWRAVRAYSRRRATRDGHTLTAQENRARAVIDGGTDVKSTRFVKTTAADRTLDEASLERARRLVGLKGYVTNIPVTTMAPVKVLSSYHDLWHVKQSFRRSRTALEARPMSHRQRDAIEARLTIVFTALAIARFMQNRTGFSIRKSIQILRPQRDIVIQISGQDITATPAITDEAPRIIDAVTHEKDPTQVSVRSEAS